MKKHKKKDHKRSHYNDDEYLSKKERKHRHDSVDKYSQLSKEDYYYKRRKKRRHKYSSDGSSSDSDENYSKTSTKKSHRDNSEEIVEQKGIENTDKTVTPHGHEKQNHTELPPEKASRCKEEDYHTTKYEKRKSNNSPEAGPSTQTKDYYSRKHEKRKNTDNSEEESDPDFTFLTYKRDLNRIFSSFPLVKNTEEFWQFVKKYEHLEKKTKKQSKSTLNTVNSMGIPEVYDTSHRFNFSINYRSRELFIRVSDIHELTEKRLRKFKDIIVAYMDFKQKDNFRKLKKLRRDQANLPVAQYRDKIISAVKNERVVIIAGDTGCGKSTQVPQYLYAAGFGKIGKVLEFL